ncbi:MAG: hypothetical protein ACE5H4_13515 [Candidatus Thorarchaeota archaeon]
MTVVGTLKDGSTISKQSDSSVVASGTVYIQVTIADLQNIQAVLNVKVTSTDPKTSVGDINHVDVSGNVVGFTLLSVGAGTTLSSEIVALGL